MQCPKCHREKLRQEQYEETEIDRCPLCRGIFLDAGELDAMLTKAVGTGDTLGFSPMSDAMDRVPARCHRCETDMVAEIGPADIRLDRCKRCGGVFLDQGELATLQLARS